MSLPKYLRFNAFPKFLKASGDEAVTPTFTMVAYTGGLMNIDGFPHPVVVDLNGLEIPSQNIPIRLDHKSNQGVGHTTRIAIENNELIAEGLISRETESAHDVAESGTKGFPWKASIGGPVEEADFIPQGQHAEANGQSFEGPIHLIRKMILKEISFVDNAADTHTSASVEGNGPKNTTAPPQNTPNVSPPKDQPSFPAPNYAQMQSDIVQEMRAAAVKETNRIEAIRRKGLGKQPELEAKAIAEGWDVNRFELELLRILRPIDNGMPSRPQAPSTKILEAVAMYSAGISMEAVEKRYDEKTLEAADKYRGIGLQEFCELACDVQLPRFKRDASGWIHAAFSTTSLPGILSNIANKMLLEGYEYVDDSWRKICKIASVNDFKQHTRYRLGSGFKFEKIGEDGELKHGQIDEQKFTQKADTHGVMFSISRQMIINDDLGALTDIPRQIGMGAAEAICDALWELLLSNPKQAEDNKEFMHKDRKNYLEGLNTELNIAGLTKAEIAFSEQTKPNGRPLGIPASILLVPMSLKIVAEMLMKSTSVNETTKENEARPNINPHAGKYQIVSTSYLSSPGFENSSAKAWYLLADPYRLPALEVAYLGGQDRPTVERADADFNVLGIQFRGYHDFGVKEQDYRGILKMKGEA